MEDICLDFATEPSAGTRRGQPPAGPSLLLRLFWLAQCANCRKKPAHGRNERESYFRPATASKTAANGNRSSLRLTWLEMANRSCENRGSVVAGVGLSPDHCHLLCLLLWHRCLETECYSI